MHPFRHSLCIAFLATLTATPLTALACSSCGCTLNADWATQGLAAGKGWRFDLRTGSRLRRLHFFPVLLQQ